MHDNLGILVVSDACSLRGRGLWCLEGKTVRRFTLLSLSVFLDDVRKEETEKEDNW